jgi:protein-disulfide isomerase
MANRVNDTDWVNAKLAALEPRGLNPAGARALGRLRDRDRRFRVVRRNWIWASAVATVAMVVLVALPSKSVCCAREDAPPATASAKPAVKPAVKAPVAEQKNYKQSGSPNAPVVCEIYSDFECPSCAVFYRDTFPQLNAEYVKTGKVRIVHRDFPLPQHRFARLAARYANAAGEIGKYDAVFVRLFATQAEWDANGNIEAAIAPVLTTGELARVKALVADDSKLNETVADDMRAAISDRLNQTPTVVVVSGGIRNKIAGAASYDLLRAYLEEVLKAGAK